MILPRKYISYSQLRLWLEDKEKYRARYYRNETDFGSKALLFGSEISKRLEDGSFKLPDGLQYQEAEHEIRCDVDDVPFLAWLDTFDPVRLRFREYKTGSLRTDGKDRWNKKEVDNHLQLDIYSLMIETKYGKVEDECWLDWLEVKKKIKTIQFNGLTLSSVSNDLELSGRIESFSRIITHDERMKAKALIKSVAYEISADYSAWLKANLILSPTISPESKKAVSSVLSGT